MVMKAIKFLALLFVAIAYLTTASTLQSCKKDDIDPDNDCDTCAVAYKPNIYLYPTEKTLLTVNLKFPKGGKVIKSIPEYGKGWNASVDTNGLINDSYTYLFYESSQPDIWQREYGWTIKVDKLDLFFRKSLINYGFKDNEIEDFIDYWIPRLKKNDYYSIYPQTKSIINKVIELNISKQPDNLLRLFYFIEVQKNPGITLKTPIINHFEREGFFVTEWGVILNKKVLTKAKINNPDIQTDPKLNSRNIVRNK